MLMHRDVIMGVRALLKGEWEVLEDDMDVWPYDLKRIMSALHGLDELLNTDNLNSIAVRAFVDVLKNEIRPLRADRDQVGSDIRFPFYALKAGFQLYGDPDVSCGHIVQHALSLADYELISAEMFDEARKNQRRFINKERRKMRAQQQEVTGE